MENWMKKYEDGKEKTYEDIINDKLNRLLDLVDNSVQYKVEDKKQALTHIVKLYEELKECGYDFDEKDMIFRKKQLVELRFRMQRREYMKTEEADSWNEFKEEEQELEDEER